VTIQASEKAAREVVQVLQDAGFEACFAGGCVRDSLLGLPSSDYDVATSARPQEVCRLFRRTLKVGIQFGIVVVVLGPERIEVATFRSDGSYEDGRRPSSITYTSAELDAQRRDFTINGLFYDPVADRIDDYVGGRADIERRVIRAIGDPEARIREDHLRLLRAIRFTARFDFRLDEATASVLRDHAALVATVSAERIHDELKKILKHPSRAEGLRLALEFGLLRAISAPVTDSFEADQERLLKQLSLLPEEAAVGIPWAILCQQASLAKSLLKRLKSSNSLRDEVLELLDGAQRVVGYRELPLAHRKRLLRRPAICRILELARVRAEAAGVSPADREAALAELARFGPEGDASLRRPPVITGDLLKELGLRPGRHFKILLERAEDLQLEGLLDREELLTALRSQYPEHF